MFGGIQYIYIYIFTSGSFTSFLNSFVNLRSFEDREDNQRKWQSTDVFRNFSLQPPSFQGLNVQDFHGPRFRYLMMATLSERAKLPWETYSIHSWNLDIDWFQEIFADGFGVMRLEVATKYKHDVRLIPVHFVSKGASKFHRHLFSSSWSPQMVIVRATPKLLYIISGNTPNH